MSDFVHLKFHSDFSLLKSCCSVDAIHTECRAAGYDSIALTDDNSLAGVIKFYKNCLQTEDKDGNSIDPIKPLMGITLNVSEEYCKTPVVLIAKSNEGYNNIVSLTNIASSKPQPFVSKEDLFQFSKDTICFPSGLDASVQHWTRRGKIPQAIEEAKRYKDVFGEDFYLEVQNNGQSDQDLTNAGILEVAKKIESKVIATNDIRHYRKEDIMSLLVVQANKERKTVNSEKFSAIQTPERYLKTYCEMKEAFKDFDSSVLSNTVEIAEKCNLYWKFGGMILPKFNLPDGFTDDWEYLKHLAYEGLKKRGLACYSKYVERLEDELYDTRMVNETKGYNFARYFLIVWDYVNYAIENNIYVGAGRGSACGSLLLYCLFITNVDPIKYGLYWWRFLTVDKGYMISDDDFV